MRRREFIPVIGAVVVWPFVSRAERTARARRIGVLIGVGLTTRKRRSSAFCRGCSKLFIVLLFAIAALPLLARDRGQFAKSTPEMKAWFDALKSERGPCCSDADGTVVSDVDWDTKDGHYRVRLDGEWIDVPDDALITEPNRAGRTMVWPMPSRFEGDAITIRCFMPGSLI
jgi:hypothetical protein